jgi:hypothetical protein
MRELSRFTKHDRVAIVKGDGGRYVVEMYINDELNGTKVFAEHTLRIVENFAKAWANEE